MAVVLTGLMHGLERDEVLSTDWEPLWQLREIEPLHPEVDTVAAGSFRHSKPPAIKGSGYVVEGKFLAGAYPGSPDSAKHCQRIEELWGAGIRTFINLVEENETNNAGQSFRRYDDVLRELGQQAGEPIVHLRFPVRDLSVPTPDGMRSILDAIDLSLAANRPVYLHCFGGVGRSGTAVCCWLLRHGLAKPQDVLRTLQDLRQADHQTKGRKSPETKQQIRFVETWPEAWK